MTGPEFGKTVEKENGKLYSLDVNLLHYVTKSNKKEIIEKDFLITNIIKRWSQLRLKKFSA